MKTGHSKLGDYFVSSRAKGREGLPLISVTLNNGLVVRDSLDRRTTTSLDPSEHLLVKEGDIAYNMMRVWQGALGRASSDGLVSPAYVVLRPRDGVDSKYAEYLFKTPRMIYLFWAYSYGLTKDRLRLYPNDFKRIPAKFPSQSVQEKVSEILSTWDDAIEALQSLVDLYGKRKRSLIRSLVGGELRVPGFSEEWKKKSLSDLVEINYGKSPASIISRDGVYPVIGTGGCTARSDSYLCGKTAIVLGRKGTIDKPALVEEPFWPIDTTFYCLPKEGVDIRWVFYSLLLMRLASYSEASGVPSLSRRTVENIKLMVPGSEKEQQAISLRIKAADAEIETLQQRLDCLRQEKCALMQQLLTGKRRVKVEEEAVA